MIEVKNLTKRYGSKTAVSNISFTAEESEILGFLGPNGAGKSTTMNILTGYLSSTEGEAKINGIDILEEPVKAKQMIGYLPEQPPLYLDMTVMEYLKFVYGLKKVQAADQLSFKGDLQPCKDNRCQGSCYQESFKGIQTACRSCTGACRKSPRANT